MTTLTALSLGAGVQSTALLLMAAEGLIDKPDVAVFADTGWEPGSVYAHLDRLEEEVAKPAGIPLIRVKATTQGGITLREHLTHPDTRYFRVPLFMKRIVDKDGTPSDGRLQIMKRSCTQTYKLEPIKREYRRLLGAATSASGAVGSVPDGSTVTQQIGISLDELQRARDSRDAWIINSYPLLDLRWSRTDCQRYLIKKGWGSTEKSACVGCPFHSKGEWRRIRDTMPSEWADTVALDEAIRNGPPRERTDGTRWSDDGTTFYLHSSGLPIADAIDDGGQLGLFDEFPDFTCSPFECGSERLDFQNALAEKGVTEVEDGAACGDKAGTLAGVSRHRRAREKVG